MSQEKTDRGQPENGVQTGDAAKEQEESTKAFCHAQDSSIDTCVVS